MTNPEPPSNPGVFTTRRRRGSGTVLGVIAAVVAVGLAVILLSRLIGDDEAGNDPTSADSVLAGAADSAEAETPEPPEEPVTTAVSSEPAEPVVPVVETFGLTVLVEPDAASVTLDDSISVTAGSAVQVRPGSHRVRASARGYLSADQTIEVSQNDTVQLTLARAPPPTGLLSATANLPGTVSVDGQTRGAAPLSGLRLRTGTYTLRFVPEAGEVLAQEQTVEVRAGQTARAAFEITDGLLTVAIREPRWATVYDGETRLGDTPLINRRLPARVYRLRLVREGYRTRERLAQIAPGGQLEWVDIVLEREVQP
ncbi:MAG: PEGA domain-containing protein [Gemmatimonadota bacterium]